MAARVISKLGPADLGGGSPADNRLRLVVPPEESFENAFADLAYLFDQKGGAPAVTPAPVAARPVEPHREPAAAARRPPPPPPVPKRRPLPPPLPANRVVASSPLSSTPTVRPVEAPRPVEAVRPAEAPHPLSAPPPPPWTWTTKPVVEPPPPALAPSSAAVEVVPLASRPLASPGAAPSRAASIFTYGALLVSGICLASLVLPELHQYLDAPPIAAPTVGTAPPAPPVVARAHAPSPAAMPASAALASARVPEGQAVAVSPAPGPLAPSRPRPVPHAITSSRVARAPSVQRASAPVPSAAVPDPSLEPARPPLPGAASHRLFGSED